MSNITFNFSLLLKLGMYIFLPVIILIFLSWIAVALYSRKIKKDNIEKYYYIMNYWMSFIAIIITIALLIITIIYAYYFTDTMKNRNLVIQSRIIYHLVFVFPVIPFSFLIYYVVSLIKTRNAYHQEKNFERFEKSQQQTEYDTSYTNDFHVSLTDVSDSIVSIPENEVQTDETNNQSEKSKQEEIEIL